MIHDTTTEQRVLFDFAVEFSNGGGMQGQEFRLDIEDATIDDAALADYIVRDMRLLMVKQVHILKKQIISERHKRAAPRRLLIDVSHTVEDGMITYKGLPAPIICDYLSRAASHALYAAGTEFQIGKIEMVGNTGTYLDSPFHRFAAGKDLAALDLAALADLDCMVVHVANQNERSITSAAFAGLDVRGKAVLVHTSWDRHWRSDQYFEGHPFLTADAAQLLVDAGTTLVGIDSYNIDDTADGRRPVHTALLGADIPIVEHLCGLEHLPDHGSRFFAVPVKVKGFGTFPVRAFAIVE
ncbi:MAG: cyclase family protein [Roseiflexaceae bacterium]